MRMWLAERTPADDGGAVYREWESSWPGVGDDPLDEATLTTLRGCDLPTVRALASEVLRLRALAHADPAPRFASLAEYDAHWHPERGQ